MSVNLDAQEVIPPEFIANGGAVDITDPTTYNHLSSITIYDSQGSPHVSSTYYVANNDGAGVGQNEWDAYFYIDGVAVNSAEAVINGINDTPPIVAVPGAPDGGAHIPVHMIFDASGALSTPIVKESMGPYESDDIDSSLLVEDFEFTYSFGDLTQFSSSFAVRDLSQDGLPVGTLTGIDIGDDGAVLARFSNGGIEVLGKVALTRFANSQGLTKVGDTTWKESLSSGEAISGQSGDREFWFNTVRSFRGFER